jgi:hypothetical protein
MPAGTYAVVRYIADPARDEPINIGVAARGPAGAVFRTDQAALDRMRVTDPYIDPVTIPHVVEYIERLVDEPILRLGANGAEAIEPWSPDFLAALGEQLPERFTLGRPLFIEYADESRAAMEAAAEDLSARLVKPVTRRPAFPHDPGAPFERLKKLLVTSIKSGRVMVRANVQGTLTRRVRQPDFYYRDRMGRAVVVETVKLTQRPRHIVSKTADAAAFELLDLKTQQGTRAVAIVEPQESPTADYFDARQSIEAVADEIIDTPEGIAAFAEQVERELVTA